MKEHGKPAIDPKALHDLWLAAGRCLAAAQALESDLKFLLWLLASRNIIDFPLEKAVALIEGGDKQTLGRLLRTSREHVQFDSEGEQTLRTALSERNRFVHGYISDRAEKMVSPVERDRMIAEIKSIRRTIIAGDKTVRDLVDNLLVSFGTDPLALQAELQAEFRKLNSSASLHESHGGCQDATQRCT